LNSNTTNFGKEEWLLVIRSNTEDYQEYRLKPGSNNIGREVDNAIILHDSTSSGYHAEIHYNQTKTVFQSEIMRALMVPLSMANEFMLSKLYIMKTKFGWDYA